MMKRLLLSGGALGCLFLFSLQALVGAERGQRNRREAEPARRPPPATAPAAVPCPPPAGPTVGPRQPTRIRLDVFTLRLSRERGAAFSLDDIQAKTAVPSELLAEFAKLGDASLSYRFDDRIDLAKETKLNTGSRVPVVQDVSIGPDKKVTPSVNYQDVGCVVKTKGVWRVEEDAGPVADLTLRFDLSDTGLSSVALSSGVELPIFSNVSIDREVRVKSGQPYLSAVIRPRKNQENKVEGYSACVIRLQLDRADPQD